ncbi:MAG TPA: enoyl-CoA hydratase-related protein [Paracoccaceae bacterium]|nr:enoyl-CoA hydratase-related protein [Paracoccaceae bacterium]
MDYGSYQDIRVAQDGRLLTLTLDRPDSLNAVTGRMHRELSTIFGAIAEDDSVDLVVLTGAGRAFCAGGDIGWMQEVLARPGGMAGIGKEGKQIVRSLLDLEKPVICRLNGDAVGLGATLALFCDIIIADEAARIGDPHVRVGLVAGDGGAVIWPQLIGYARAKEFLMTGDLMTARQGADIGLINKAVPAAELDAEVRKLADKLLRGAQQAIRWTKVSVNVGLRQLADSILDASIAYEVVSSTLPDHAEAVAAFAEGRRPVFGRKD